MVVHWFQSHNPKDIHKRAWCTWKVRVKLAELKISGKYCRNIALRPYSLVRSISIYGSRKPWQKDGYLDDSIYSNLSRLFVWCFHLIFILYVIGIIFTTNTTNCNKNNHNLRPRLIDIWQWRIAPWSENIPKGVSFSDFICSHARYLFWLFLQHC